MVMSATCEHIGSYYAATLNWQTDYPQLEGGIALTLLSWAQALRVCPLRSILPSGGIT